MLSSILLAGIGIPELILLFLALMFFIGIICLFIYIIKITFKRDHVPSFPLPEQHYHVNVGNSEKQPLTEESALKKKGHTELH